MFHIRIAEKFLNQVEGMLYVYLHYFFLKKFFNLMFLELSSIYNNAKLPSITNVMYIIQEQKIKLRSF